jgi:hypothetical protein
LLLIPSIRLEGMNEYICLITMINFTSSRQVIT